MSMKGTLKSIMEKIRKWANKTERKEKEDFAFLYKQIQNEVVRERIRASGEWYIEYAIKYKRRFFIFSVIGIAAPLLITVFNSCSGDAKIMTALCSVAASFSSAFLAISKSKEKWTNYRDAIELIKKELTLYAIDNITDDPEEKDKLKILVEKTEKIMQEEHDRWNSFLKDNDKTESKKSTAEGDERKSNNDQSTGMNINK